MREITPIGERLAPYRVTGIGFEQVLPEKMKESYFSSHFFWATDFIDPDECQCRWELPPGEDYLVRIPSLRRCPEHETAWQYYVHALEALVT